MNRPGVPMSALATLALWLSFAITPAWANLFVSSLLTSEVLEYNGTSGAFVTAFVSAGSTSIA